MLEKKGDLLFLWKINDIISGAYIFEQVILDNFFKINKDTPEKRKLINVNNIT